ncbi:MAG: hypothetical protein ACXW1W_13025 [Methylococcaceae bacterium]
MKQLSRLFTSACLVLTAFSAAAMDKITENKLNVMTLNQYLGADLTPVLAAPDSATFNDALVNALAVAAQSDFRSRALAQADAIAQRAPDVLSLQEVWNLSCSDFDSNPLTGCEDPMIVNAFLNHLELTMNALKKKGAKYKQIALVKDLDLAKVNIIGLPGIPFNVNGIDALLVAVDQDVILVRDGIKARPVTFPESLCQKPSVDGCNYQTVAEALTPAGPLTIERGFVAIDTTIGGKNYRIFDTHLEVKGEDVNDPLFTFFQASQASELIQTIDLTIPFNRSVLVLGDMNSSPVQEAPIPEIVTPYSQFSTVYFDIWELKPGDQPGYTCCQPEDLLNRRSALSERIDMIFSLDKPEKVSNVSVISAKTSPYRLGVWFSDHAAVAAEVTF